MGLNPQIIRDTFEIAKPIASEVISKFYENLFSDYPQSKALFEKVEMERQKQQLINALVFVVDNLENEQKLVPYLKNMGARHVVYKAETEHYEWVGKSMLKTLAFFFKEKWTPEIEGQWKIALGVITDTMIAGAAEAQTLKRAA